MKNDTTTRKRHLFPYLLENSPSGKFSAMCHNLECYKVAFFFSIFLYFVACHYIETSQLICKINKLTGLYRIGTV